MNQPEKKPFVFSGVSLAICGTFLFALKSIFIKLAFSEQVSVVNLLTLRMFFSLPFYVVILIALRRKKTYRPISKHNLFKAVLLGFFGYYLASFLDLQGLFYITAQLERLTLFTYPALVAVLAWLFLGEEISKRIILALLLCYGGVLAMYGGEVNMLKNENTTLGVVLVMGAALSYSIYILFAKPTMIQIGSREFTCWAMIGSTIFVGVHFLLTQNVAEIFSLPTIVYVYGLLLAFVCTVIPSYMINEAILKIGATRTTVIGTIGPVLTMILAILLLGEPSSVWHFFGMFLAIVGVSLVAKK